MMGIQTRTGGYYFLWRTNPISNLNSFYILERINSEKKTGEIAHQHMYGFMNYYNIKILLLIDTDMLP